MRRVEKLLRVLAWCLLTLAIGGRAIAASPAAGTEVSCQQLLGKAVVDEIRISFPEWHVVGLNELRQDDRNLWTRKRGALCPSVAVGRFQPGAKRQYAVLLRSDERKLKLILVTSGKPTQMMFEGEFDVIPVIYRRAPGPLKDAETRHVDATAANDVLVVEVPEAGSSAYYFDGGRFKRMELSL